jgi:ribose transport system substrate-binding protein
MKKSRIILALVMVVVFAFTMAACGGQKAAEPTTATEAAVAETTAQPAATEAAKVESKKIGFSVYDMQYGFFQDMEKGTKSQIEAAGYEYVLHDEKSDATLMVSGCQDLINQGIAALIISPNKPDALGPIVEAAHKKNIPVIVDDIGGGGSNYDVIVISDCFGGGKLAGEYAIANLKDGSKEAAIIKCEPSAEFAIRRGEGFKEVVTKGGFKIVKELSGHSKQEEGYSIMKDVITSNPKVQVVFCENDPMAVGAAQACQDAKRSDIMVIGFNNDQIAQDAIKAGTMAATIAQYPEEMGKLTVKLADQLIKGEKLTFGDAAKREIYAGVKLITKADLK